MQFRTSIHDYEIGRLFERFRREIGDSHWRQRVKLLENEIRGNKFLRHHHLKENDIAYGLNHCSHLERRYGGLPVDQVDLTPVYPAIAFASHCLSMLDQMDATKRPRTIGRIQGAFRNPEDMRALKLEFTVALHFAKRGHRLAWPELAGENTFDLLVEDLGPLGMEVECKAVSEVKGRRISSRHALDFWHLAQSEIRAATQGLHRGLSVILTLPDKLPTSYAERRELAKLMSRTILSGQSQVYPQVAISMRDFDSQLLHGIDWDDGSPRARELIESITGTRNRHAMINGMKSGGAVICVIQSSRDDALFDAIQKTIKRAAAEQLTGTLPGMILLEFGGMSPEGMVSLAEHDNTSGNGPTALRRWASEFLANSSDRDHVVGLGFLSRGAMIRLGSNVVSSSGSAYVFPKRESRFWNDAFSGLFDPEERPAENPIEITSL